SGAWKLWEKLAQGRPAFGNPAAFNGNIAESSWISYTVTVKDPLFLQLMERFSGSAPGTGGLITFKGSWCTIDSSASAGLPTPRNVGGRRFSSIMRTHEGHAVSMK
ncbi:oleate hydratase, partial [Escherichia coli]|uniref:oleate hydratase n=1 Tax=Escherichia coli TaxID=562 RepID=UPI001BE4626E